VLLQLLSYSCHKSRLFLVIFQHRIAINPHAEFKRDSGGKIFMPLVDGVLDDFLDGTYKNGQKIAAT